MTHPARPGRRPHRLGLAAALVSGTLVAGCDLLMTEPAPATTDLAVSFQIQAAPIGGSAAAFSRVNRVHLVFVRADSATRDTTLSVLPVDGTIRARVALPADERIQALGIGARLAAGAAALFEGGAIARIVPGEPISVNVSLAPIAAAVFADRDQLTLPGIGASTQLAASVLFATGDTIDGAPTLWTSEDPTIVSVTPAGLALAVRIGQTRLEVRRDTLADTVVVDVLPPQQGGQRVSWTTASDGNWSDGTNWSSGSAPAAGDTVEITNDGTYTVTMDQTPPALASLTLGGSVGLQKLVVAGRFVSALENVDVVGTGQLDLDASTLTATAVGVGPGALLRASLGSVIDAPVSNAGALVADSGSASLTGALTTAATSTVRVGGGTFASQITVPTGFTNNGTVELGGSARLVVSSGTLVNAPAAQLNSVVTPIVGTAFLTAVLDNRGSMTLDHAFTLDRAGATHLNAGTITANAGFAVAGADGFSNSGTLSAAGGNVMMTTTGTGAGVTTSGVLTVAAGRIMILTNGPFTHTGGRIDGGGVFRLESLSASLANPLTLGVTAPRFFQLANSTLSGPTLTTGAGSQLLLDGGTLAAPLDNQAALAVIGTGQSSVTGAVTSGGTSRITVEGNGPATELVVANGFTNNGILELTGIAGGSSRFSLTTGTLLNAGQLSALAGGGGGTRTVSADVSTTGTVFLTEDLTIEGQLIDPVGAPSSYQGNGNVLTVAGLDVDGGVFDAMPVVSVGGALDAFTNATFQNMDPTATQLTIAHPGTALPIAFTGLTFATRPTTGLYVSLTDSDGLSPLLVLEILGSSPASGLALSAVSGGATLIW